MIPATAAPVHYPLHYPLSYCKRITGCNHRREHGDSDEEGMMSKSSGCDQIEITPQLKSLVPLVAVEFRVFPMGIFRVARIHM